MRRVLVSVVVAVGLIGGVAGLRGEPAAGQPAGGGPEAQAGERVTPDLSSPMANWRTQKKAMAAGDAEAMAACYVGNTPDQERAIKGFAECVAGPARFGKAVEAKFGEKVADRSGLNMEVPANAKEQINGETAVLMNVGGPGPVKVVKKEGQWRIPYVEIPRGNFRDLPVLSPAAFADVCEAMAKPYEAVLAGIDAGTIKSRQEAEAELLKHRQAGVDQVNELIQKVREGTAGKER